jgi:hypothetical protein
MPSPAISLLVYCCLAWLPGRWVLAYGLALLAQNPGTGHSRVVTALTSV